MSSQTDGIQYIFLAKKKKKKKQTKENSTDRNFHVTFQVPLRLCFLKQTSVMLSSLVYSIQYNKPMRYWQDEFTI